MVSSGVQLTTLSVYITCLISEGILKLQLLNQMSKLTVMFPKNEKAG